MPAKITDADDVDVAEPALHPADQRQREVVDAVGDAGVVHQVAGEDEERHREQREAVDAADHPVHDHHRRRAPGQPDVDERRARHRDGDRDAGHHQREEHAEQRAGHRARIAESRRSCSLDSLLDRVLGPLEQRSIRAASSRSRPAPSAACAAAKPNAHTP